MGWDWALPGSGLPSSGPEPLESCLACQLSWAQRIFSLKPTMAPFPAGIHRAAWRPPASHLPTHPLTGLFSHPMSMWEGLCVPGSGVCELQV